MAIQKNSMPTCVTYAIHLRCPSSSGGKDWIGFLTSGATQVYAIWGKTVDVLNTGGQGKHIRVSATRSDLGEHVRTKLAKGYNVVDEYSNGKWDSENIPAAASAPKPNPPPSRQPKPAPKPPAPVLTLLSDTDGESGSTPGTPEAWFW